ncbi:T-complex protein 1 subunit beta [Taenia solium]|eukprot:TsM_000152800 transcript=TsM_000152800 gene=TsM_000152800
MAEVPAKAAASTPGRMAIVMETFATALRRLPVIIADSSGYDSAELVSQPRAAHATGNCDIGLGMENGCITSVEDLVVNDSYNANRQMVISASEAAETIIRAGCIS